jgi:hypothetical protein
MTQSILDIQETYVIYPDRSRLVTVTQMTTDIKTLLDEMQRLENDRDEYMVSYWRKLYTELEAENAILKARNMRWNHLVNALSHWVETDEPGSESQTAIKYVLEHTMPGIELAVQNQTKTIGDAQGVNPEAEAALQSDAGEEKHER